MSGFTAAAASASAVKSASRWPPMARARRPANLRTSSNVSAIAPAPCTGEESMIAVNFPLNTPVATALANVASNSVASASCSTIRARIKLNVVAPIPSK